MKKKKKAKAKKTRLNQIISVLVKHNIFFGLTPVKFREILEDLGPTYIKIGQILSLREDILGKEWTIELSKLQSNVPKMSYEEVSSIFSHEFNKNIEDFFSSFNEEPLGSASIAQVHKATLKNNKEVVVKIQRPNLFETLKEDVLLLKKAISILKKTNNSNALSLEIIVNEMWMVVLEEINFKIELEHILKFRDNNQDIKYIEFPAPIKELTTEKVLVMEYINGYNLSDKENLVALGYDLKEIAAKLCENYCKQILDDGFFHADPHYGNLKIREGKICYLDLGMVGQLSNKDLAQIKKCVIALVESDIHELKEVLLELCKLDNNSELINHPKLYADLEQFVDNYAEMDMRNMNMSEVFGDLLNITSEHHLNMPAGFSLLCRGIITIQGIVKDLDPNINLLNVLTEHIKMHLVSSFNLNDELKQASKSIYSSSKKMLNIPAQVSDFLKMTNKGYTKVNVEVAPEKNLVKTINNVTDKIVMAVITAASILGSSVLCTTDMQPKLFGIPLIGVLGFLISFIFGAILLFKIINFKLSIFKNKTKK